VVDARQAAYLEALGIDVYVRRALAPKPAVAGVIARDAVSGDDSPDAPVGAAATEVGGDRPTAAPDGPSTGSEALDWDALSATVSGCERCALHSTRTQTVFGVGNRAARWMFIGEAPGAEEDRQGEPFVGRAGQLLTSMLKALGLKREDVYIANVLKCRPPGNRDPRPEEARSCRGYLERQIELVDPALIVAVGRVAAQTLLETDAALARLRGRVHGLGARQRPLMVIYHPAYLLRSPGEKRKAWLDLIEAQQVFQRLERGEQVLS
jgi:uracil-DNA glycosylase family 4